jgi:hypothetical protein
MSRIGRVLLIVGGCLVGLAVVIAGAAWLWWATSGEEYVEAARATATEGREYGQTTDEEGCLQKALTRHGADLGISETVSEAVYLIECLDVSKPSPGFCDGIPDASETMESARWKVSRCEREGFGDRSCQALFGVVQEHCSSNDES